MNSEISFVSIVTVDRSPDFTFRSPEMFAPARIPVAAGKKMAKTEKNVSPSRKFGEKFSAMMDAEVE